MNEINTKVSQLYTEIISYWKYLAIVIEFYCGICDLVWLELISKGFS